MVTTNGRRRKAPTKADLQEAVQIQHAIVETLQERIVELEDNDIEWQRISQEGDFEFSRDGLGDIIHMSRLSYLKNPLINHAVEVQAHYVFGQGFTISSNDPDVNEVIQDFLDDPSNQRELTGHQSAVDTEEELTVTGNLFLSLFSDVLTGRVVVRSIPVEEIGQIIFNPDDRQEPWYYKRSGVTGAFDVRTGVVTNVAQTEYYPDINYRPTDQRPQTINGNLVRWDAPVYHAKVGGFKHMAFGVPEIYSALDWSRAVKNDLEDYASIKRAQSRIAAVLSAGSRRGVNALKTQFGTTIGDGSNTGETNPPPVTGSYLFTASPEHKYELVRTSGVAASPDEGRRLWLMVSAGTGIPETILAGDADVGNLATSKSLDRPTELKMQTRQQLWTSIFHDLLIYVVEQAATAPQGKLNGTVTVEGDTVITLGMNEEGNPVGVHIDTDFPPILERSTAERVAAVISAATLDGKPLASTMTFETLTRLLLTALGVDDIDEEILRLQDEIGPDASMTAESRFSVALDLLMNTLRGEANERT